MPTFGALRPEIPVELVPGVDHMGVTMAPEGRAAAIKAAGALTAR